MDYSGLIRQTVNISSNIGSIIAWALILIGMWKIFTKAGKEGWPAIIPFYNMYILCKIAGRKFVRYILSIVFFAISMIACLIFIFLTLITGISAATSNGSSSSFENLQAILGVTVILFFATMIWYIVERAKLCGALSRSFGHGGGYAAGLFFLGPIFLMILGFNSDQYIGPNGQIKQQPVQSEQIVS